MPAKLGKNRDKHVAAGRCTTKSQHFVLLRYMMQVQLGCPVSFPCRCVERNTVRLETRLLLLHGNSSLAGLRDQEHRPAGEKALLQGGN